MAETVEMEFSTTFWADFSIADRFGKNAIRETYKRAFEAWKSDYLYLTDLVMVLNHKIWQWWEVRNDHPYVELYNELWEQASQYALDNLKGEEFEYYYRVTD